MVDREHRPENLGPCHIALDREAIEHRRPHEVPATVTGNIGTPAVDDRPGAVLNGLVDEAFDPAAAFSRDDRAHLYAVVESVAGHAAGGALADRLGERSRRIAHGDRE